MLTLIIIFLILLPIAFLRLAVATSFSAAELNEMGVCLESAGLTSDSILFQEDVITAKMCVACANP